MNPVRLISLLTTLLLGVPVLTTASAQELSPKTISPELFQEVGTYGGAYRQSLTVAPATFSSYGGIDGASYTVLLNVFDALVGEGPNFELQPSLAESWEILEEENAVIFHLRPGVSWHDGEPFTADDVIFTFENLVMNPNVRRNGVSLFTLGGKPVRWTKVDDLTVRADLPVPYGAFLRVLTNILIMPEHKLADKVETLNPDLEPGAFNNAWSTGTPLSEIVGTGPFILDSYTPDQRVVLRRNESSWLVDAEGNTLPYVDTLEYLIVPNTEVQTAQFLAGQIDALALSGAQFPDLKEQELAGADFTVLRGQTLYGSPPHWSFNWDAKNPELREVFRNETFRHAMAYVLDRERIIEDVYNTLATPSGVGVAPVDQTFYNPAIEETFVSQDLEQAAAMLDELGYVDNDGDGVRELPSGAPFEFNITTYVDSPTFTPIATILQNDLERIGVRVNLDLLDDNLVFERALAGSFESMVFAYGDQPDPQLRKDLWQPGRDLYYWRLSLIGDDAAKTPKMAEMAPWEREVFEVFEQGQTTLDQAERAELYGRWQMLFAEHLPVIFIAKEDQLAAVRNRVGNAFVAENGSISRSNFTVFIRQ